MKIRLTIPVADKLLILIASRVGDPDFAELFFEIEQRLGRAFLRESERS